MTKYVLSRPGAPWDYPSLGFRATADGAILDGSQFTPTLDNPPDAYWSVYGGGSAETSVVRYTEPSEEYQSPVIETPDGYLLVYSTEQNTFVPTRPLAALAAAAVTFGTTDPADILSPGTEYVWNKTDGAGTLIDIVSGVA